MTIDLKLITPLLCKKKVKEIVDDIDEIFWKETEKLEVEMKYFHLAKEISRLSVERDQFCKNEYLKRIANIQSKLKDDYGVESSEKDVVKVLRKMRLLK
jgi:hypothetical protein